MFADRPSLYGKHVLFFLSLIADKWNRLARRTHVDDRQYTKQLRGNRGIGAGMTHYRYRFSILFITNSTDSYACQSQRTAKGASGRGRVKKNVKNRQKVSKIFSTLFDIFRAGQKASKIVKKCQKSCRHFLRFSRCTRFPASFGGLGQKLEEYHSTNRHDTQRRTI